MIESVLVFHVELSEVIWLFRRRKWSLKQIDKREYNSANFSSASLNCGMSPQASCKFPGANYNHHDKFVLTGPAGFWKFQTVRIIIATTNTSAASTVCISPLRKVFDVSYSIRQFNGIPPLLNRKVFLTTFPRHDIYHRRIRLCPPRASRKSLRWLAADEEEKEEETRVGHGLRGDFKLISMWDFCLPRKQRTSGPSSLSLSLSFYFHLSPFALPRHVLPTISSKPNPVELFDVLWLDYVFSLFRRFFRRLGENFLRILYSAPMSWEAEEVFSPPRD